jgi:hypothetical protein
MPLEIKHYLMEEPIATLEQIIGALELPVCIATLHRYLEHMDCPRQPAKRANRLKRFAFCKNMA